MSKGPESDLEERLDHLCSVGFRRSVSKTSVNLLPDQLVYLLVKNVESCRHSRTMGKNRRGSIVRYCRTAFNCPCGGGTLLRIHYLFRMIILNVPV